MLKLEIVSSRVVDGFENEKKFVAYMVQVRQDSTETKVFDPDPVNVERRYTHFLDLYNGLKKDHPAMLHNIAFPRKIVVGNFDPSLISARCASFESLLCLVASESRLREAPCTMSFFQDPELSEAKRLISEGKFDQALSVLETSFKLLNKVYTDRARVVLSSLCRIVACAGDSEGALAGPVERWAQLALKRYEAVSDSDLLLIYIPLLHTCISIWYIFCLLHAIYCWTKVNGANGNILFTMSVESQSRLMVEMWSRMKLGWCTVTTPNYALEYDQVDWRHGLVGGWSQSTTAVLDQKRYCFSTTWRIHVWAR